MKQLLFVSLFFMLWNKYNRINEMNVLKSEAALHYQSKEYAKAILDYEKLIQQYAETDEWLKLNLANCYFIEKKTNSAVEQYKLLSTSGMNEVRSIALLQLGVLYSQNNKKEIGIQYFKEALKAYPENNQARYNYELLKKEDHPRPLETTIEKKKENASGANKTTTSFKEEYTTSEEFSGDKGDVTQDFNNEESNSMSDEFEDGDENEIQYNEFGTLDTDVMSAQRLKSLNMTDQQAKTILKSMQNAEIQYIQQRQKVGPKNRTPNTPDW